MSQVSRAVARLPTMVLALIVPAVAAVAAVIVLVSFSDHVTTPGLGQSGVTIRGFDYEPKTLTVEAG